MIISITGTYPKTPATVARADITRPIHAANLFGLARIMRFLNRSSFARNIRDISAVKLYFGLITARIKKSRTRNIIGYQELQIIAQSAIIKT